jgi:hypothetical protein
LVPDSEAQTGERTKILDFGIAKRSQIFIVEELRICDGEGKYRGRLCVGCGCFVLCSLAEALFGLAAALADDRHVLAIGTDDSSTFFARAGGLFGIELMGATVGVSGSSALRTDGFQRVTVHHRKATTLLGTLRGFCDGHFLGTGLLHDGSFKQLVRSSCLRLEVRDKSVPFPAVR